MAEQRRMECLQAHSIAVHAWTTSSTCAGAAGTKMLYALQGMSHTLGWHLRVTQMLIKAISKTSLAVSWVEA